ncbi:hypothetical protein DRP04_04125 [Archaeoglobales archaeon]|nr:MAG: hypothetical protein DRP04_04125 [Archaeoglobales archaeon]
MSKEAILILISHLKDWLHQGLEILSEFQQAVESTPSAIIESPESEFLAKGSQVYARILKDKNEVGIYPIESLQIKVNDAAISWLQNKVFEKAAAKHGFQYQFVNRDGFLEAIKVRGQVSQEEIDKLLNATKWAFEKASSR